MRSRALFLSASVSIALVAAATIVPSATATPTGDVRVSVGSPHAPFTQNKQNEPAVAIDPAHPWIVAAGANDEIDLESCNAGDPTSCPFTGGIGTSGIYFSMNGGHTWTQPTYRGLTARGCLGPADCVPSIGPIGTLPGYNDKGLQSDGDPALAFGPAPGSNGFSWSNGSRLYYANLTSGPGIKGAEAIAVSRTDDVTAAAAGDASAWMAPVIASKQSSTTFSDKEQVWADNAASSPFFGNAYVCISSFRSLSHGHASPNPMIVATSTDGGTTWTPKQVTPSTNNPVNPIFGFGRSGCTIRTDSNGKVYVFANQFAVGLPGVGWHIMVTSTNGGASWSRPVKLFQATDGCFVVQNDGTSGRCVADGLGGARNDLSSSPSLSIANGAPTGADASNLLVDSWVDGQDGLAHMHVMVAVSKDGGATWSSPVAVERAGDSGYYSAAALSPGGTDLYVVYNAFTTPPQTDLASPRELVGVVLHADVAANGTLHNWTQLHRSPPGDARGSSQNNLVLEFLGDYVYAGATNAGGVAVWNDTRNAVDCPAVDAYRTTFQQTLSTATRPAVGQVCRAGFGDSDIYGWAGADPTP